MALSKKQFSAYILQFNFRELFNDMGWNNDKSNQPIAIDNITFTLQAVAEKSGFKILVCNPAKDGLIPDYKTRKKIESKVTKLFQEHLIIYIDVKKQEQIWQLVVRQTGKPTKVTETRFHISQDPELLFQRAAGIFFEMDEEEKITIVDVTRRIADNFHQNNEKVTKQFYESFKKEHTSFLTFIKGIDGKADKDWYASLMLNRLMFCYFIQKKGFLDTNKNYLRDKLKFCTSKQGKDKFYSFYRSFLLVLFHEGLNEPAQKEKIKIEIGKIPYLNGGLFDEHELEKSYEIDIDDKAFERIFDFFDEYEWHLDTRTAATGKDINPDVIGYIFEKYINDRAQMGAYYTKEDITDYISKNCIIPWLFDETARHYPKVFTASSEIWTSLKESGDEYIYDAVKHGTAEPLLKVIQAGVKDVDKRTEWNKQASAELGLPTEIWREVVERRNRYEAIKKKIASGEITSINDFITYNLNIRQFTQNIIESSNDADFIRTFYKSLNSVTIIDPTCGSGAFLFAAMNILEPLYQACIMRMRAFTEDEDRVNELEKKTFKNKYKYFREVLENIQSEQHPSLQYFIYKSIILNNLYGVDIMREAVEIAKLRLFLKLVATVEADYKKKNLGLEPLPDIDFNIRAGNTLIGFATINELKTGSLDFQEDEKKVLEELEKVSRAFKRFKEIQLSNSTIDYADFKKAKNDYQIRLDKFKVNLTKSYFNGFGNHKIGIKKWVESHQPFHWFAEFYEIVYERKGFDIIIGNPPYVEYSKVNYELKNYTTLKCGNLYAFVIENCLKLISKQGKFGMIVPISSICTDRMIDYQKILLSYQTWNSLFAERPSKLFSGADVQLVISLFDISSKTKETHTSTYNKWGSEFRDFLFDSISYIDSRQLIKKGSIPKIGTNIEKSISSKLQKQKKTIFHYRQNSSKYYISYRNAGGRYYKVILNYEPEFIVNGESKRSSTYQSSFFENKDTNDTICAIMNSTLFFWYWLVYSDTWHMINREIASFPIELSEKLIHKLSRINEKLIVDLQANSVFKEEARNKGKDKIQFTQFFVRESKSIIDKIDEILAEHYGFTDAELDYIINYDIKYRMSKEIENDN